MLCFWLQWADVLALSGDAAENIPGVKGIGIKTAPKLLQQFGDLESLLANAEQVEKKVNQAHFLEKMKPCTVQVNRKE